MEENSFTQYVEMPGKGVRGPGMGFGSKKHSDRKEQIDWLLAFQISLFFCAFLSLLSHWS